jgi:hypothetical protein
LTYDVELVFEKILVVGPNVEHHGKRLCGAETESLSAASPTIFERGLASPRLEEIVLVKTRADSLDARCKSVDHRFGRRDTDSP